MCLTLLSNLERIEILLSLGKGKGKLSAMWLAAGRPRSRSVLAVSHKSFKEEKAMNRARNDFP